MTEQQEVKKGGSSIVPPKVRKQNAKSTAKSAKGESAKTNADKPKKKAGFGGGFIACFLLFVIALGGFGAAFWFNLADIKTQVVTALNLNSDQLLIMENRKNELATIEAELSDEKKQLASDQQALDAQSAELAATETSLNTRASELDTLEASLSEQQVSMDSLVGLYEAMEPKTAAAVLTAATSLSDNITIIKNLNQNKLALILAEMTPAQASEIIGLMSAG